MPTTADVPRPPITSSRERTGADVWKNVLLSDIAYRFCLTCYEETSQRTSAWQWSAEIPYPAEEDIVMYDSGSLTFVLDCGGAPVYFSTSVQYGEIRIGVRPQQSLTSKPGCHDKLQRALDGTNCSRVLMTPDGPVYEWIFRDGVGSLSLMIDAIANPTVSTVIADRVASIMTQIYIAVTNILIDANKFKVVFSRLISPSQDCYRMMVLVSGSLKGFETWIDPGRGTLISRLAQDNGATLFVIETINENRSTVVVGDYIDSVHGEFRIHRVESLRGAVA